MKQLNWKGIGLLVALVSIVGVVWWAAFLPKNHDPEPEPTVVETIDTPPVAAPPVKSKEPVTTETVADIRPVFEAFATAYFANRFEDESLYDWWQIDKRLADISTEELRYEFVEYPDTQTVGVVDGEKVQSVVFKATGTDEWDLQVILTGDKERTVEIKAAARMVAGSWKVTVWEVQE